jgi:hypothetical protein
MRETRLSGSEGGGARTRSPALQPVPLTSLHAANTVPWRGSRLPEVAQASATRGRRDDGEGLDFQPATLKLIAA